MSIKVEEVIEAYKKTGLRPIQDEWFGRYRGRGNCACALTAIVIEKDPPFLQDLTKEDAVDEIDMDGVMNAQLGLSYAYIKGFTRGFDGYHTVGDLKVKVENQEDLLRGFEDGKAIWKAVKKEFHLFQEV